MRRTPSFLMFLTIASVLVPAVALAQPPVVSEPTSSASFAGATTGHGRGFGVGAVEFFAPALPAGVPTNLASILATWGDSGGRFHIDGLFGLNHQSSTTFDLGVRGWYHIHAASSADLSVGAGFALVSWKAPAPLNRQWDFEMELGAEVRVFVVSNVALLGSVGMGLYVPDNGPSALAFAGNLTGSLGLAYYFM